ncbi:MAG: type II secretion system GspH family protein [Desulfomonile sp.]|nr:type II secretion system GspH family protein [Desulfomonile sp.]
MNVAKSRAGFTIVEMIIAMSIICVLIAIYYFMIDSYKDRRMSELAAKVLMQAQRAEEDYFKKEHRYFDAEVSGSGGETFLTTPGGIRTTVRVPSNVILSLKTRGSDNFVGFAFYTGSKVIHRYDSKTGKITTASRTQDETG